MALGAMLAWGDTGEYIMKKRVLIVALTIGIGAVAHAADNIVVTDPKGLIREFRIDDDGRVADPVSGAATQYRLNGDRITDPYKVNSRYRLDGNRGKDPSGMRTIYRIGR